MIFQPAYSRAGSPAAPDYPGSLGRKAGAHLGQDMLPSQGHSHTHTHSDWGSVDAPVHLTRTSSGRRRKLEDPEKTHSDVGKMCKHHTHCGSG